MRLLEKKILAAWLASAFVVMAAQALQAPAAVTKTQEMHRCRSAYTEAESQAYLLANASELDEFFRATRLGQSLHQGGLLVLSSDAARAQLCSADRLNAVRSFTAKLQARTASLQHSVEQKRLDAVVKAIDDALSLQP